MGRFQASEGEASFAPFYSKWWKPQTRSLKIGDAASSEAGTVSAYVLYFQFTAHFPSWMSRVRSPSPAPTIQSVSDGAFVVVC